MIWDVHGHLSGISGNTPEERMTRLLTYADRMGVERLCVYMGMKFLLDPSPAELRQQNDELLQAISHYHDRAFGFVYLNPNHVEASLQELERCVAQGPMVGVKLWVAKRCNSPELDPLIKRIAELQAPILQHTWYKTKGNLPGESTSEDLAELARRHPTAKFICGHAGGDWRLGIRAIRDVPNIVVDTGGSDPTTGFVEMAVRELGESRVVFGSDLPGRSLASQLAKVQGADVSELAKRVILRDNLRRLLEPILTAKGVKR
ncbi:MAG: amidohydrolase family protein [Planctomycetota bacterium]|jgi:predicted TIM-barrel fold metal-dependent hydrolase